ncbi:MAG TPA: hypothetical protein PLN31_05590 [Azoarcus taiwanensis]|nr:hypothetical protein [Azoarcus taiwanensis]
MLAIRLLDKPVARRITGFLRERTGFLKTLAAWAKRSRVRGWATSGNIE